VVQLRDLADVLSRAGRDEALSGASPLGAEPLPPCVVLPARDDVAAARDGVRAARGVGEEGAEVRRGPTGHEVPGTRVRAADLLEPDEADGRAARLVRAPRAAEVEPAGNGAV